MKLKADLKATYLTMYDVVGARILDGRSNYIRPEELGCLDPRFLENSDKACMWIISTADVTFELFSQFRSSNTGGT